MENDLKLKQKVLLQQIQDFILEVEKEELKITQVVLVAKKNQTTVRIDYYI